MVHNQFTAFPTNTNVYPWTKFDPVILITVPPASEPVALLPSSNVTLVIGII